MLSLSRSLALALAIFLVSSFSRVTYHWGDPALQALSNFLVPITNGVRCQSAPILGKSGLHVREASTRVCWERSFNLKRPRGVNAAAPRAVLGFRPVPGTDPVAFSASVSRVDTMGIFGRMQDIPKRMPVSLLHTGSKTIFVYKHNASDT